jgi:hypothetical protein
MYRCVTKINKILYFLLFSDLMAFNKGIGTRILYFFILVKNTLFMFIQTLKLRPCIPNNYQDVFRKNVFLWFDVKRRNNSHRVIFRCSIFYFV